MTKIDRFVAELATVRLDSVFNPYSDICPVHDHRDSARIRCSNLREFLAGSVELGIDSIWFGRDLGYRGGRRTGLALTDEAHLPLLSTKLGKRAIQKATASELVVERTATIVWGLIEEIGHVPFMWNAFPLHPHEAGNPLSNRSHTRKDLRQVWDLNLELLDILKPQHLIAIGNDAHQALSAAGLPCTYVRHPSYGGKADFTSGIRSIYKINSRPKRATKKEVAESQLALID